MSRSKGSTSLSVIITQLNKKYPDAKYELNWETPLQLLVATVLAAQCTDKQVNKVTPALFKRYAEARDYAEADLAELEELIRAITFCKQKAKTIKSMCQALVENFKGEVPTDIDDMITLPGVARKTANVVLNNHFRIASGIIVDAHVARVCQRLGLTSNSKPEKIEQDLMAIVPKSEWVQFGPAMVLHGRYTCTSKIPKCDECMLAEICPKIGVK